MSSPLVIIERDGRIFTLLYHDTRLVEAKVHTVNSVSGEFPPLHSIYIGKVKNVVPGIDAAFIELINGKMGFLPMKYAKNPIIVNRKYDGRILSGDEILVQVEKESIKTKDPGLTCNLSFTGKYCVLTTGNVGMGFSSKLNNSTKAHVKEILEEWNVKEILDREKVGMVLRTNVNSLVKNERAYEEDNFEKKDSLCQETSYEEIYHLKKEMEQLIEQKNKVMETVSYRTCFSCLYQPLESYLTDIRDTYDQSFDKIITNKKEIYDRIMEEFPNIAKVEFYEDSKISLEKLYSVETRLKEAIEERVWLKSGAYLVIQQTEALTVIDVNSGKVQKKNPSDHVYFEINQEAAKEIALQLKLRNLSGIIIVDFINQNKKEQDVQLLSYFEKLVKKDPVKTNIIDMTPLGLVEVTRKKIHKSLKEQLKGFKF